MERRATSPSSSFDENRRAFLKRTRCEPHGPDAVDSHDSRDLRGASGNAWSHSWSEWGHLGRLWALEGGIVQVSG
jgi:hypothetical protein